MVKKRKPQKKKTKKNRHFQNPLSNSAVRLQLQGFPHALPTLSSAIHKKQRRKRKKKHH